MTSPESPARSSLEISVVDYPGAVPRMWTLTCDPLGGDHPAAEAACHALEAAADPFAPVPADLGCIQVYGGPEIATITGHWDGRPVAATYRRSDGCEIARWDALAAVLAPPG